MKIKTLITSSKLRIFLGALVMTYAFMAGQVLAAVNPSVDTVIKNNNNAVVTSSPVGTIVKSYVTVSSSTGPVAVGTVDFNSYQNTTCSGTASIQAGVLLASGSAESATTTLGNSGLSYKVKFNGQQDVYNVVEGNCVSVLPTSSLVTISSSLSSTSVSQGASVYQSVTLNNTTTNATGTVAYGLYTNSSCSADRVDLGTKTVNSGIVPASNSTQFNNTGTYYFQAVYSGDQLNNRATSTCQSLTVSSVSNPNPTPVGQGSISGTIYNDLNRNRIKDSGETGISNVTVKLHGGTFYWWNWNKRWSNNMSIKTTVTDSNGNYSFTSLPDGIYSVEEIKPSGWRQISSDYRWVLVINGKSVTGLDFANVQKNSSTTASTTPIRKDDDDKHRNRGQEKKAENMEKKELKKEEQKQKKINKLQERIEKIKNR